MRDPIDKELGVLGVCGLQLVPYESRSEWEEEGQEREGEGEGKREWEWDADWEEERWLGDP
jgi:hypothetical protein